MVADCSFKSSEFSLGILFYHCLISLRQIQAFIYDASPLQYQVGIDKNCQLMLVGKPYAMSGYAIAFPKGQTELKEEMDDLILELQDDGKDMSTDFHLWHVYDEPSWYRNLTIIDLISYWIPWWYIFQFHIKVKQQIKDENILQ